jgi:hypothetical protein
MMSISTQEVGDMKKVKKASSFKLQQACEGQLHLFSFSSVQASI